MARGKTIDKWDLVIQSADGTKTEVQVPVKMIAGPPTKFFVSIEHEGNEFSKTDTDIDSLKADTETWLKSVVAYDWEEFFYVEFYGAKPSIQKEWTSHDRSQGPEEVATNVGTVLKYSRVLIAKNGKGEQVFRDLSERFNRGRVNEGTPDVGFEEDAYIDSNCDADCSRVLVRRTPEAEAVLKSIVDGFSLISDKLRKFLKVDGIEKRFASKAAVRLLSVDKGSDDAKAN